MDLRFTHGKLFFWPLGFFKHNKIFQNKTRVRNEYSKSEFTLTLLWVVFLILSPIVDQTACELYLSPFNATNSSDASVL